MRKFGAALTAMIDLIHREFGPTAVLRFGDPPDPTAKAIPSGSAALDRALGIGGLPRGRIVECFGNESSGKTTLALHVVANAQRAGGVAAFIDVEHALDLNYARRIGVNLEDLLISQPSSGEEALTICDQLVKSGEIAVLVVDSVAALAPRAELDGAIGDCDERLQARLVSQSMRLMNASLARTNTLGLFINQTRERIGVRGETYETTPGGQALKLYAACRLHLQSAGPVVDSEGATIGRRTRVRIVKNRVAPPFADAEFDILPSCGIPQAVCPPPERMAS